MHMNPSARIADLVSQLDEALRTYDRLAFDEVVKHPRGKPCTDKQLARIEKRLGQPLPPSYRAFLELHNGWGEFSGESKLLSVEDHGKEWVQERLDDIGELCDEEGVENPFENGAVPVLLGEDTRSVLYVDPRTVRPDGEMDFVALDIIEEERRFPDFAAFLEHKLGVLRRLIEKETRGASSPESP
jgi:hypothetical protein